MHTVRLITALLLGLVGLHAPAAAPQQSAASVVQITAKVGNNEHKATGFVWHSPTGIVTALHVVAGAERISVYSEPLKKERPATLKRVHLEADLALLELAEDIGLTPLAVAPTDPNSSTEHEIWGYPHNVATLQGDVVRFSKSLGERQPTLNNIFRRADKLREAIGAQGFPKLETQILRLGSTIQPGHSGAPIFDAEGRVIGIGDGGLRQGIARLNWAIPAAVYLPGLADSLDPIPTSGGASTQLFSTSTADQEPPEVAGREQVHYVGMVTLAQVLESYGGEAQELAELTEHPLQEYLDTQLAIYEEQESGATFVIPAYTQVSYNPSDERFHVTGLRSEQLEMYVVIHTSEDAHTAMARAERYLADLSAEIELDATELPGEEALEEGPFYLDQHIDLPESEEGPGESITSLIAIDEGTLLAATVLAYDSEEGEDDTALVAENDLLLLCSHLIDFTVD